MVNYKKNEFKSSRNDIHCMFFSEQDDSPVPHWANDKVILNYDELVAQENDHIFCKHNLLSCRAVNKIVISHIIANAQKHKNSTKNGQKVIRNALHYEIGR